MQKRVRVPNEPESEIGGAFAELLRLQTEFHTRLTEETWTHLRRLQGAAMPVAPTTVLMPGGVSELRAEGSPGAPVELKLELENRQRVHCVVTPMLSPLVETSGVTWFPSVEPITLLLAPAEIVPLAINVALPDEIPAGVYRGALLLQGFRAAAIAVAIQVGNNSTNHTKGNSPTAAKAKAKHDDGGARSRSTARKNLPKTKKGRRTSPKTS